MVTSWVRTLETPYVTYCYNLIQVKGGCSCKQPEIGGVVTSWVRTLETPYVTYCYNLIQV